MSQLSVCGRLDIAAAPWMPLMASGGINLDNLAEWLERGVDCCGMGSLLTKGSKEEIAANAAKVRAIRRACTKPVKGGRNGQERGSDDRDAFPNRRMGIRWA